MDSLDFGNFPNIYGNQGALQIQQSCSENSIDLEDIDVLNDSSLSINSGAKSRIFIGPNSDDDDPYKLFMVCAENKINALMERVREFIGNLVPEEFEDKAVSMAIQQHGLRKSGPQDISHDYDHGRRGNNSTTKSLSAYDVHTPTTSNNVGNIIQIDGKCEIKKKKLDECSKSENKGASKEGFDVDDMFFLNEAVAAAIKQKGLCSSDFDIPK